MKYRMTCSFKWMINQDKYIKLKGSELHDRQFLKNSRNNINNV